MKVLIGCEESGVVRRAFAALGHDAYSCDILPARDDSSKHLQQDLEDVLKLDAGFFDLGIFHPPCTHVAGSGARWLTDHWVKRKSGNVWHDGTKKRAQQIEAVRFFKVCLDAKIPRVAIENPVGMISTLVCPPTQYIQPWQFGHGEQKKTGLWLKNLPSLQPTNIVSGREQRIWKVPPGPNRQQIRSETFQGIADAMAAQWGAL